MTAVGDQASHRAQREGRPTLLRPTGALVWIHFETASEVIDSAELVRMLQSSPTAPFVLLTTNEDGVVEHLRRKLPQGAVHQYLPIDQQAFVGKFLDYWRPDYCIWASDTMQPNIMTLAHKRGVKLVYANANPPQISRFKRFLSNRYTGLLKHFVKVLPVSIVAANRCAALGVTTDNITVMPALKSGGEAMECDETERAHIAKSIGGRPIWYGIGVQDSELEMIIAAQKFTARRAQRLLSIIQPAQKNQLESFERKFKAQGFIVHRRSECDAPKPETQVYLIDSFEEEGLWLRIAPVTYIGCSFDKAREFDPLKVAALGSAIIHGPEMNFSTVSISRLQRANATRAITDQSDFSTALADVIAPDVAAELAQAAWLTTSIGAETTDYLFEMIQEYLAEKEIA
ncbi:3-deoxy-D-manno-octulosonic acid transferase [Amylibacter ulvae]|uniref:3-deoxy-D-manno-octulosonic acid transferase n=1 Tax=Paramylibacter ulvae TaxID=1651968 RepID=A0ABQ3CXS8_9RHOB|nr:glycosyltransferase N-terminal domain-containing protein [Amylibacter ulvae]GHA47090.1 3-deoxy-D-manno-octulosonic acid transferase [Amylibacter ulvae]